ncbi:MAG: response regulator [Elainella sp. C42_A2020_010]|nr:response regulator [Elainella sp. C42_A2020_010]
MGNPLRILLIDDNPDDRLLLNHELERQFPTVQIQEILEAKALERALEAGEFDLVVTDYQLCWGTGIQVLQAVRARYPFCPVIMFTATGNEEIAVTAMKEGLDDYILKTPNRYARIPVAIQLALERAAVRQELAWAQAEQARLLQQEQAARAEAEAANRLKDEFLATLSHELRTPLTAMLGWTQLLVSQKLDETTLTRAAEVLHRNTRSQLQLIEDLLDVSSIITGKLQLTFHPVDLGPVIESAIDTVRPTAEAKRIDLSSQLDSSVTAVAGDANRLRQVMWNLLTNAIKFTPEGGRVKVRLSLVASHTASQKQATSLAEDQEQLKNDQGQINDYSQITVTDTGQGIPKDILPYIFERFRQVDGSTTRKQGGLGLGLAIARHIVELHGGSILAESQGEGQGATFTVKLPLLGSREEEIGNGEKAIHSPLPTPHPPLSGLQILVVDDEPDTCELVSFVLEQAGAIVTTASSAQAALELLKQSPPKVLVCDIAMPDTDGYALIQQIRSELTQQDGQILAIALSAYARELDRQRAIAAGFQQHIAKPVEPEALVKAIANLLSHS